LYIISSIIANDLEDGTMVSRRVVSEFSSLVLCFAAAYVWLVVG